MINISNSTSKDNPPPLPAKPAKPGGPGGPARPEAPARAAPASTQAGSGSRCARLGRILAIVGRVLLSWLTAIPGRLGDRLFVMNDTEAYWRSWQITKTHAGLARRYRDPRFGTLAECPECRGTGLNAAGVTADLPCVPCLGTGRITRLTRLTRTALGEVS